MEATSLISIIIPVFNRVSLLKETIASIQNQSYKNWECILVDDGSTEETQVDIRQIINNDKRFKYYSRPSYKRKGPTSCRNYGFEKAKGEFIYFFDSDDFLKPFALEAYTSVFQVNTDGVLAHLERIDKKTGNLIDINCIDSDNLLEDYFLNKVSYFVCGILWRKSFLDKQTELFDENLGNLDDWDFNLRMIYTNPNIVRLDQVLVTYFQYEDSFKKEIQKGNDIEINSAFKARFKHLELLAQIDTQNRVKYSIHIADFYKKIVRNKLFANQENWFSYYQKASGLYLKSKAYLLFLKLSLAILVYKLTKKGYYLFD